MDRTTQQSITSVSNLDSFDDIQLTLLESTVGAAPTTCENQEMHVEKEAMEQDTCTAESFFCQLLDHVFSYLYLQYAIHIFDV